MKPTTLTAYATLLAVALLHGQPLPHENEAFNRFGSSYANSAGPGEPGSGSPTDPNQTINLGFTIAAAGKVPELDCAVCHWLEPKVDGQHVPYGQSIPLRTGQPYTITALDLPQTRGTPPADFPAPSLRTQRYTLWPSTQDGGEVLPIPAENPSDPPLAFAIKDAQGILQFLIDNREKLLAQERPWPESPSDDPLQAKALLLPIEIKATSNGFPPTGLTGKYDKSPEKGSVDNLISIWPAEELKITIEVPEPFKSNPPAGLISWNAPGHTVPDQTTEFTFSWLDTGTKTITITVGGSTFRVVVDLPNVGNTSQGDALLAVDPITSASVVLYGVEAMIYSNDAANFPTDTPKKDAIRHSYWTALCASDTLVDNQGVLFVTTAHEHNNKWNIGTFGGPGRGPQQAFNSTMDLRNNLIGIATGHFTGIGTPDRPAILQDLNQQYQQGLMWIYDGNTTEGASEGILSKSNRQKIYPP